MKPKVYIDGQAGTTGLSIKERLSDRKDIELLLIDEDRRHDEKERKRLMGEADLIFLCLPDDASRQAMEWIGKMPGKKVIDTSTAFRTEWTYGFGELDATLHQEIIDANYVANPGCHASGVLALLVPLIQEDWIDRDALLSAFSITGYSGGGKKMIAEYEIDHSQPEAPQAYSLQLHHKHLPEIQRVTGMSHPLLFLPIVDDFYQGMNIYIPLHKEIFLKKPDVAGLLALYRDWYINQPLINVNDAPPARVAVDSLKKTDMMEISVFGNDDQFVLSCTLDNLGKGACGAAIQNMNLMLGLGEYTGLNIKEDA